MKTGLDDYLLRYGAEDFYKLPCTEFDISRELRSLNEQYAYLRSPAGRILRRRDNAVMAVSDFRTETESRQITTFNSDGSMRKVPASKEWLKFPFRSEVTRLVYTPRRYDESPELGDGSVNLWQGWAANESKKGDVSLFIELIDRLCDRNEDFGRKWFLQWLAYPIQYPGVKLVTAVVLRGVTGSGKTLLGYTMRDCVYGPANFSEIKQTQIESQFNDWLACKQFILAEEVAAMDKRAGQDKLKSLITQATVTVNRKHQPPFELVDHANYLFTSNHPDPLSLDEDDRRFYVLKVRDELPQDFRDRYGAWYRTPKAASAMMWYLSEKVDVSDFDPYGRAPMTAAKEETIKLSRTDIAGWIEDFVIANYEQAFAIGGDSTRCDFQTSDTIARLYDQKHPGQHAYPANVGKILSKLADLPKYRDKIVRLDQLAGTCNGTIRPYAFRNLERWKYMKLDAMRAHWDATHNADSSLVAIALSAGVKDQKRKFQR